MKIGHTSISSPVLPELFWQLSGVFAVSAERHCVQGVQFKVTPTNKTGFWPQHIG